MGMDRNVSYRGRFMSVPEFQRARFVSQEIINKVLEEKTTGRDPLGVLNLQFAIILCEHRVAGRLQENDGSALLTLTQEFDIVRAAGGGVVEISLTECRPAAAPPSRGEHDFEAKCLQNFHRRDADMRLVISNKSVVPENDAAAGGDEVGRDAARSLS